jgi:putative N-acetyltransferase (TIGR04045 family)
VSLRREGGEDRAEVISTVAGPAPVRLSCRLARTAEERAAYFALRRAIFCAEQGLFGEDDRDDCDARAYPVICLAEGGEADAAGSDPAGSANGDPRVVGVVRLWEDAPGDWWGGRLGVDPAYRTEGSVGRRLVQTAVGTARAWGATRFRATVQRANVPFFRRLRWRSVEELVLFGQPHHLMQAELEAYAPIGEARPDSPTFPPTFPRALAPALADEIDDAA